MGQVENQIPEGQGMAKSVGGWQLDYRDCTQLDWGRLVRAAREVGKRA